ncbi:hypothetical protein ACFQ80_06065 [Isoptericola sp. NPDC056578]|uniref:hypothetical protein n=1 Tax=Isoptericola sp. NPDC056578 TaxID=3345870 RepID=UPI0036BF5785
MTTTTAARTCRVDTLPRGTHFTLPRGTVPEHGTVLRHGGGGVYAWIYYRNQQLWMPPDTQVVRVVPDGDAAP